MPETKRPKRRKIVRRIYWPNCAVCSFMQKHKDFRYRCMQSTYFVPIGTESLAEVVHAFGDPFPLSSMYAHMQRHQVKDLKKAQIVFDKSVERVKPNPGLMVQAVEGDVIPRSEHEIALLEVVQEGRAKLAAGELPVTLTGLIQASTQLANIEKSTKDRRLDAMKSMFSGAKENSSGNT